MKSGRLVGLGLIIVFVGLLGSCEEKYETAEYEVVKLAQAGEMDKGFELRDYAELVMVAAPMENNQRGAQNKSFRKLFNYISQGNEEKQKIAMTTPVFARSGDEGRGKKSQMYFVMPKKMQKKDAPKPKDKDLKIVTQKKGRYAVYTYSGRSNFEKREKAKKKLLAWVTEKEFKTKGGTIWAGYDPPWTPGPMRRNEVLVEVESK